MALVQGGLTGKIIARVGERHALVIGLISAGVTFVAFAFITQSWQAYVLFLVSALSGLIFPAMNGLLSRMVDASHQGALQGGIGSMGSVSSILGPLLLTQALATGVDHGFPGAAFLLAESWRSCRSASSCGRCWTGCRAGAGRSCSERGGDHCLSAHGGGA